MITIARVRNVAQKSRIVLYDAKEIARRFVFFKFFLLSARLVISPPNSARAAECIAKFGLLLKNDNLQSVRRGSRPSQ